MKSKLAVAIPLMAALGGLGSFPALAQGGRACVVASPHPDASKAGMAVFDRGGNVVDAAVATAFALGVLTPDWNGLGGGGCMIIRLADRKEAKVIDFETRAPLAAKPDMFIDASGKTLDQAHEFGGLSVAVPGEVKGLLYALDNFGSGKLGRAEVMQAAIDLAEKGFPMYQRLFTNARDNYDNFTSAAQEVFWDRGGTLAVGRMVHNRKLAASLRAIRRDGADAFYKGDIAKAIVAEVEKQGGILSLEDLAGYQIVLREPLAGTYRSSTILTVPPPVAGGALLVELLNILENFDLHAQGKDSPATAHLWSEALKLVFADRNALLGDPEFVSLPLEGLVSKAYAASQAGRIDPARATSVYDPGSPGKFEKGATVHVSVMDGEGNAVALTTSVNGSFGSGIMASGTGIILNNYMLNFDMRPGRANSVAPGKHPLSSMCPSILLDAKARPILSVGAAGALRIFPSVAQVISNMTDYGMAPQAAIAAPRLFQAAGGSIEIDKELLGSLRLPLAQMGHGVTRIEYSAIVQAVLRDPESGQLSLGVDPRGSP